MSIGLVKQHSFTKSAVHNEMSFTEHAAPLIVDRQSIDVLCAPALFQMATIYFTRGELGEAPDVIEVRKNYPLRTLRGSFAEEFRRGRFYIFDSEGHWRVICNESDTPEYLTGHTPSRIYYQVENSELEDAYRLLTAADENDVREVERLIAKGVDLNVVDFYGCTALMLAATWGHLNVVQALIRAGANLDMQDDNGNTALLLAYINERHDTVGTLIEAGADINLGAHTMLHLAVSRMVPTMVRRLITMGVDTNKRNAEGLTAEELAQRRGYQYIVDILQAENTPDIKEPEGQ